MTNLLVSAVLTGLLLGLVAFTTGFVLDETVTYFVILVGLCSWFIVQSINGGIVREFKLDNDRLEIKKLIGQSLILHKNEIQKVEWKNNKFVFHKIDQPFPITTSDWAMTNLLFYWIPENLLPIDVQYSIKEAKSIAQKPTPTFEEPLQVRTRFSSVELSNEGFESKTLFGERFFRWSEMEIVEIRSKGKELKIWVKGRYTRIRLPFLSPEQKGLLQDSFLTQLYTRGIPVCYSETRF